MGVVVRTEERRRQEILEPVLSAADFLNRGKIQERRKKNKRQEELRGKSNINLELSGKSNINLKLRGKSNINLELSGKSNINLELSGKSHINLELRDKSNINFKLRGRRYPYYAEEEEDDEEKIVCVTSAASFLGVSILKQLLARGYSVRALIDKQEDMEVLVRELETSPPEFNVISSAAVIGGGGVGRITNLNNNNNTNHNDLKMIRASPMDVDSLHQCFEGCRGVFHTSSFIDPAGSSGYSKTMAEIEKKGSENVMEACMRTASVRRCVLTSSLLACIWKEDEHTNSTAISTTAIRDDSWSDESICTSRKLWYALGKLKAEKAAWRIAKENSTVKLATICPGLITGPNYTARIPTPTLAYLKGCKDMYARGLLATVDIKRLARAHICVYEAMNKSGSRGDGGRTGGRYICFDRVIRTEEEADKITQESGAADSNYEEEGGPRLCALSNAKLSRLIMARTNKCSHSYYYSPH